MTLKQVRNGSVISLEVKVWGTKAQDQFWLVLPASGNRVTATLDDLNKSNAKLISLPSNPVTPGDTIKLTAEYGGQTQIFIAVADNVVYTHLPGKKYQPLTGNPEAYEHTDGTPIDWENS